MNDDKTSRARDKVVGTAIFGILVVVPFSIRIAIQGMDAVQDFLVVLLVAVGCGGLYSLYCDDLRIELLSRYKAHGAIAVVLLVLLFMPKSDVQTLQGGVSDAEQNGSLSPWNTGTDVGQRLLGGILHSAPKAAAQVTDASQGSVTAVRIVYPIGDATLKQDAFAIQRVLQNRYPGARIRVYSIGSLPRALLNQFRDFGDVLLDVAFDPGIGAAERRNVLTLLKQSPRFTVGENNAVSDLGGEDVILRLGR